MEPQMKNSHSLEFRSVEVPSYSVHTVEKSYQKKFIHIEIRGKRCILRESGVKNAKIFVFQISLAANYPNQLSDTNSEMINFSYSLIIVAEYENRVTSLSVG